MPCYFTQYLRGLLPARAGLQRIEEFLAEAVEDSPGAEVLAPFSGEIAFENVSFAYEGVPVITNLSLRIRRGSNVAIVGPSGSGKSTIVTVAAALSRSLVRRRSGRRGWI